MAKFSGQIGYVETLETRPGVWEEKITIRNHFGDVMRNVRKSENGSGVNDDVTVNNQISIIGDPFLMLNFYSIRYVKWMGCLWKVASVDVQSPRLILTLGGIYNE